MSFPTIEAQDRAVRIELHGRAIRVDGSAHILFVDTPSGEKWEIGATRAGLGAVCGLVLDRLDVPRLGPDDARAICDAVTGALRRTAADARVRAADVERKIDAIRPTPLTLSEPYLRADYLREDAARFRPARVAIANVEADDADDATPEAAEELVDKLARWRSLYVVGGGKAKKSLNLTLADYGEALSVEALWGMRNVPLHKKPVTLQHAEVLGALGSRFDHQRLHGRMDGVERTSPEELTRLLHYVADSGRFPSSPPQAFAELVATLESRSNVPRVLVLEGLERLDDGTAPDTKLARPPIPLPVEPEVRFIETYGELASEGQLMNHCVATRMPWALAGEAFIFHVATGGKGATVQVDDCGQVYEARGFGNHNNETVRWAIHVLERWGRGFWVKRFGLSTSAWRHARAVPTGVTPLRTVADCYDVYRRVAEKTADEPAWRSWFEHQVERAALGRVWLVSRDVEGLPIVSVIDEKGRILEQSKDVVASVASGAPRVLRVGG
jgi:hypothetical protein